VLPEGVDHVMAQFFHDQAAAFDIEAAPAPGEVVPAEDALMPDPPVPEPLVAEALPEELQEPELSEAEELRCEEEILAAFAPDQRNG
jgi:hypothetical protein